MMRRTITSALVFALALSSALPLGATVPAGQPVDGVRCDRTESNVFHIHAHLAIVSRGKEIPVPDDVGRPLAGECLYWLHTHTGDGIIHIEAPQARAFTLGAFFDIWGQPLTRTQAGSARAPKGEKAHIWVNGEIYGGDPRSIELNQHTDIVIELTGPYKRPPSFTAWNGQ